MNQKYHVIAGPYRIARRYAERKGWLEDEIIIVTRAHQLARLDPARIASIITVKLQALGQRIVDEIRMEIEQLRTLWPVPMIAAP